MPPRRATTRNKRRVADSDDDSSDHAESSQRPSGSNNKRQRLADADEEDEEDVEDDVVELISEDEEVKTRTRNKGKRRAVSPDEDEEDEEDEEDRDRDESEPESEGEEGGEAEANGHGGLRLQMQRDEDGFTPGAIVRIKMRNFMTYDFVEFNPGPKLNMILGPNGTGKSSIAAAIVIGLGFPPKTMGRATDIKSYVKQGAEVAETEIELKGQIGTPNLVIWCRFSRDSNKCEFKLNGRPTPHKKIHDVVASFDVQATNLCSFLPQDKVSDFAKMNSTYVLKETMLAAGDSRMTKWHEKLITRGDAAKDVDGELATNMQKRDQLQAQVTELAPEVRYYERRQELEFERAVLRLLVMVSEVRELQKATSVEKKRKDKAKRNHDAIDEKQSGFKDLMKSQKRKQESLSESVEKERVKLEIGHRDLRKAKEDYRAAERESKELEAKLRSIGSETRKWEQEKQRLEARIADNKAILESPQADVTTQLELLAQQKKERLAKVRPLEQKKEEAVAKHRQLTRDAEQINREIADIEDQKKKLSSIDLQRKQRAFKYDPSIQYVCQWLDKNQDKLKGKVCLPPMISANVADKRFSPEPGKNVKVGIHLATVNVTEESANPQRPCSQEQLQALGFDGWAIDFVEADAAVITFLCEYAKMHRSALTLRDGTRIASDNVAQAGITSWVTKTDSNRASRSVYGTRAYQITSNPPRPAVAFNLSVDVEAINKIADNAAKLRRQLNEIERPTAKAKLDSDQCIAEVNALRSELAEANQKMDRLQREARKYDTARIEINMAQKKLDELQNKPSPEVRKNKIQKALLEQVEDRKKAYAKFQRKCMQTDSDVDNLFKATFQATKAAANVRELQAVAKKLEEKAEASFQTVEEANARYRHAKAKSERKLDEFTDLTNGQPAPIKREVKRRCDDPEATAQAKNALVVVETDLEMAVGVTDDVINRHRRLSAELHEREQKVKEQQSKLAQLRSDIDSILAKFNPALDTLVDSVSTRFSNAFQALGCTGEVRMNRVEGDYSEWGIQILVSYRDEQELEVLTASRQSGGERSLATVTYLMSLGEMSRTPFSLVDEINQGMDARAERAVHNQMVKVACSEAAGQYFLITPKLLTDLKYDRAMKVLVVNNGVGIPAPSKDKARSFGPLAAALDRYKRHHGITA
ncbi:Structural maintenance of chromosomes protein 5 [Vanrija albida]|uniref:Structural maintenance of chromosomes protein 5 n=1 Tax=Vanrija albida TaxID=181172 RepID=A0ABR3Q1E5_9TREE